MSSINIIFYDRDALSGACSGTRVSKKILCVAFNKIRKAGIVRLTSIMTLACHHSMNWFNPIQSLEALVFNCAQNLADFDESFCPQVKIADPRFGDYQANVVLAYAKARKLNPRDLAQSLVVALNEDTAFPQKHIKLGIAGPGFINFKLDAHFLWQWLQHFSHRSDFEKGASTLRANTRVVIDYPSAHSQTSTHWPPASDGNWASRRSLTSFSGTTLIRDNHIGDWGTNFGTLIMQIKRDRIDLEKLGDNGLAQLDALYKKGSQSELDQPILREESRKELVRLQNGDPQNTAPWKSIVAIFNAAFSKLLNSWA